MVYDKNKPYNDLPKLPPTGEIETIAVLKAVNRANMALMELNGVLMSRELPNPFWLTNPLSVQEANASSAIENINTTVGNVFREELFPSEQSKETKEVLHYREGLLHGFKVVEDKKIISPSLIKQIQGKLEPNNAGFRSFLGGYEDGEFTGTKIANKETKEIYYTPPEGVDLLQDLLQNLTEFLQDDELDFDALIKIAITHYQFEAIHPFYDGNGRTGRMLIVLSLVLARRLHVPVLYLSQYLLEHRAEYYRLLRAVTEESAWEEWILFMLRGLESTAVRTYTQVLKIKIAFEEANKVIHEIIPKVGSDLTEILFSDPFMSIEKVSARLGVHRNTASKYLILLSSEGLLSSFKHGNQTIYCNDKLYRLLS